MALAVGLALALNPATARAEAWNVYRGGPLGLRLDYPDFLALKAEDEALRGARFESADQQVTLEVASAPAGTASVDDYFRRMAEQAKAEGVALDYTRRTRRFAVVSGENERFILYARCNLYRTAVLCFNLRYPTAQKRRFDPIVTRMSRSLGQAG
jgi:hypothetical protein